jgi:hypothetical protein
VRMRRSHVKNPEMANVRPHRLLAAAWIRHELFLARLG